MGKTNTTKHKKHYFTNDNNQAYISALAIRALKSSAYPNRRNRTRLARTCLGFHKRKYQLG